MKNITRDQIHNVITRMNFITIELYNLTKKENIKKIDQLREEHNLLTLLGQKQRFLEDVLDLLKDNENRHEISEELIEAELNKFNQETFRHKKRVIKEILEHCLLSGFEEVLPEVFSEKDNDVKLEHAYILKTYYNLRYNKTEEIYEEAYLSVFPF